MATGATTPDGIAYLLSSSSVDPVSESAVQASSIQAAFSNRPFYQYYWLNATQRAAQTGMKSGDQGFQQDTQTPYTYLGGGWYSMTFGPGRIAYGAVFLTTTASPWRSNGTVVFPTGFFPSTPKVFTQIETSAPDVAMSGVFNVTAAGCNIALATPGSATSLNVYWEAIL